MAIEVPNDMLGSGPEIAVEAPGESRLFRTWAGETVLTVLPDVLHYDRNQPAHYPNGRVVTDDVYDTRMAFLTHGRVTSDGVGPDDDYLTEFPFLGPCTTTPRVAGLLSAT
jgi:hypothetical protein